MMNYLINLFSRNKKEANHFQVPAMYSVKILDRESEISFIDKQLLKIILNFSPKINSLKCEINRWDNHIDYMENIRAFIYCEVTEYNWRQLGKNIVEFNEFIEHVRKGESDDFNSFLHLIEIDEIDFKLATDDYIFEKTITYINESKHDYQKTCNHVSRIHISKDCSINDYKIFWGNENFMNLIMESCG